MFENNRVILGALSSLLMLVVLLLLVLGAMSGCATSATSPPAAKAEASAQKHTYFMVYHENGRIYAMTEPKIYLGLMKHDEVPLTRTRIGAGAEGETVIFGITKADGKALDKPTAAEDIFDGRAKDLHPFYAEVVRNGRYHVFGEWKDFQDYLSHKEITFTYTEIGTGPNGETVIYALNKKTKKHGRPVALVEQFNQLRQAK